MINISQFIQTKDGDSGEGLDFIRRVDRLFDLGDQIEDRDKSGLIPFEDRFITEGLRQMGFPQSGVSDENEIGPLLDPGGTGEREDLLLGDLRVEGPIKLGKSFRLLDTAAFQEMLHPELMTVLSFLFQ